jgi:hypothetical protein
MPDSVPYVQTIGTLIAAGGLYFSGWQFWRMRQNTTLQHLQEFFKTTNERELALANARDGAAKRHALVEYMNFLEVYSAATNAGLFVGVARELTCDKIIDSIVVLESVPHWHDEIDKSVTSIVTYKHLLRFIAKNRREIARRRAPET